MNINDIAEIKTKPGQPGRDLYLRTLWEHVRCTLGLRTLSWEPWELRRNLYLKTFLGTLTWKPWQPLLENLMEPLLFTWETFGPCRNLYLATCTLLWNLGNLSLANLHLETFTWQPELENFGNLYSGTLWEPVPCHFGNFGNLAATLPGNLLGLLENVDLQTQ